MTANENAPQRPIGGVNGASDETLAEIEDIATDVQREAPLMSLAEARRMVDGAIGLALRLIGERVPDAEIRRQVAAYYDMAKHTALLKRKSLQ